MFLNWNLNDTSQHGEYISLCEKIYDDAVDETAKYLSHTGIRILNLSGPSSSGKTTTALKLVQKLEKTGIKGRIVSLDNFFKNPTETPKLPDGRPDFDSPAALDLELLNKCTQDIINGRCFSLPVYDFKKSRRSDRVVEYTPVPDEIVVFEGIHAMNPLILDMLPKDKYRSLFISVKDDAYLPGGICLSRRDIRLIRRLIRDYKYRGASPSLTFHLWDTVCEAEDKYILPYEEKARININSSFQYELNVTKHQAIQLLEQLEQTDSHCEKAKQLYNILKTIPDISEKLVPKDSVLREFLGDSVYKY
ncbi:MAG: uridine kinase [Eubacteriales bacterium]